MQLFLDANAHLPIHQKALDAFVNFNRSLAGHGNAMAATRPGREAAAQLEQARDTIANLIGAKSSSQIVFTSTCTQACEWGLKILKSQKFNKVFYSQIEHPAVALIATELFGQNTLSVDKNGIVNFTNNPNDALVCIYVHNELGTMQNLKNIQVPFFSDMSQALGKVSVNVSDFHNLKLAAFGAHKFGGPANVGILYIQNSDWWEEFDFGSRYYFDRAGTPDTGSIIATSIALEEAINTISLRYENAVKFRDIIEDALEDFGYEIIANTSNRVPYTTFIKIGNKLGPYFMSQLETDGIFVGLGSACGSMHTASSPVMTALGYKDLAHDYMRISQWGNYSENEANFFVKIMKKYSR